MGHVTGYFTRKNGVTYCCNTFQETLELSSAFLTIEAARLNMLAIHKAGHSTEHFVKFTVD